MLNLPVNFPLEEIVGGDCKGLLGSLIRWQDEFFVGDQLNRRELERKLNNTLTTLWAKVAQSFCPLTQVDARAQAMKTKTTLVVNDMTLDLAAVDNWAKVVVEAAEAILEAEAQKLADLERRLTDLHSELQRSQELVLERDRALEANILKFAVPEKEVSCLKARETELVGLVDRYKHDLARVIEQSAEDLSIIRAERESLLKERRRTDLGRGEASEEPRALTATDLDAERLLAILKKTPVYKRESS